MIGLILVAATVIAAGPHAAPSEADLKAWTTMAQISRSVCVNPKVTGNSLGGGVDAGAKATIPKLLSKLLQADISAGVRLHGERWEGVLQKDLGKAITDSNACASGVFNHMFEALTLTDLKTLKPITGPKNPQAAFRNVNSVIPDYSVEIAPTTSGPDSPAAGVIGSVTYQSTREHREKYLTMLQDIYVKGNAILIRARSARQTDVTVKVLVSDYVAWVNSSANTINTKMTPAALNTFVNISPPDSGKFVVFTPPLDPPLSDGWKASFTSIWFSLPEYLENVRYLMEHDTMDPQNAGG